MSESAAPITLREAILRALSEAGGPVDAFALRGRVERLLPPGDDGDLYAELDTLIADGLVRFVPRDGWELVPQTGVGHG